MTNNKFWLVCKYNEQNTPMIEGFFDNLQSAKELADFLSRTTKYQEYYICEATHHFKASVNVIETDLTAPKNEFAELAESTTEESLTVEPTTDKTNTVEHKFKVGDKVKYVNEDVKLVLEHPIEIGEVKRISVCKDGFERIYVKKQNTFYDFFNKEDLTLAE